jgi:L-threonylcarbamoyladenylate synthase
VTRVITVDAERPEAAALEQAAALLRDGKLVAFPTETVYGLGARALDPLAVARIFAAKGRPSTHPLIVHVLGLDDARRVAAGLNPWAEALAARFWPGPLTLIVDRAPGVPISVTGGGPTVAVRAPSHPVARALLAALGEPIAAPSANRYQAISPTTAAHVVASLGDAVELVIDGGPCARGIESTVIDLSGERPTVLRPGSITVEELRAVLGEVDLGATAVPESERRASPGMDARHYAPRTPLTLLPDRAAIAARIAARPSVRHGVILCGGFPRQCDGALAADASTTIVALPDDPAGYARALYATLHDLDSGGLDAILVEAVPATDAWLGVADRLARASTAP